MNAEVGKAYRPIGKKQKGLKNAGGVFEGLWDMVRK